MTRARGQGRRCEHENEDGVKCQAWAMKSTFEDERGPRCYLHSLSEEERLAQSKRAANASKHKRRGNVQALPMADLDPGITMAEVLKVIRPALSATNELGAPDWSARLAASAVLLLGFPRYLRDTPEHCKELLSRVLPEDGQIDPDRLNVELAFKKLRDEWYSIPAVHPLRGLIARPLPRAFVPPWLDYSDVVKAEAPKDVPLAAADVLRLPNGTMALRRPGQLPLALEEAEDDGGLIRAAVNLS